MVTSQLQKTNQLEGYSIQLHCSAEGVPLPVISWQRECFYVTCDDLDESDIHTFPNSAREVTSIVDKVFTVNETGNYTCIFTNEYGTDQISAEVKILRK